MRSLGSTIELRLPRINEGLGFPWQSSYTSDAVASVAEIYADDMRRLGFDAPVVDGLEPIRLDPVAQALLMTERKLVYQLKESFDRRGPLD